MINKFFDVKPQLMELDKEVMECCRPYFEKIDSIAQGYGIPVLGKLPILPTLAQCVDTGNIEAFNGDWLDEGVETIIKATNK